MTASAIWLRKETVVEQENSTARIFMRPPSCLGCDYSTTSCLDTCVFMENLINIIVEDISQTFPSLFTSRSLVLSGPCSEVLL